MGLINLNGLTPEKKIIKYYARKNGAGENSIELYDGLSDAVDGYANYGQILPQD